MWDDHISIDIGGSEEEDALTFVRARTPLLFAWDERRSPVYGFGEWFDRCDVTVEDGIATFLNAMWERIHHSQHTILLDQALVFVPLLLLGGWQLGHHHPMIIAFAMLYVVLVAARLRYLGWLT